MKRENEILESYKSLQANKAERAARFESASNREKESKDTFRNKYYKLTESREARSLEHGKLLTEARDDAFKTALKAIYISALEADTLTDEGLILAENMVENYVNEAGGAQKIFNNVKSDTYLLAKLRRIVEDTAEAKVDEIENPKLDEDEEVEDNSSNNNGGAVDIDELQAALAKAGLEIVHKEDDAPAEVDKKEESESEEDKTEDEKFDDSDLEIEDTPAEDDKKEESEEEVKEEDKSEDTPAEDDKKEEKSEEKTPEDEMEEDLSDGEEVKEEDKKEAPDAVADEAEGEQDDPDSVKVEDDEDTSDADKEIKDIESDEDEKTEDESAEEDSTEDNNEEDSDLSMDDLDDEDENTEDDEAIDIDNDGDPDVGDVDEPEATVNTDPDKKMFEELENEDEIKAAVELIRTRVADAEEAFIKRNAEDKKQIDELLGKISNNINTVNKIANDEDPKSKIAQEAVVMCKRKINEINENKSLTIYEKMTRNLTKGILEDESKRNNFIDESGFLDTALVTEASKVMYGFLETLNTLQLESVDGKYIQKILSEMK